MIKKFMCASMGVAAWAVFAAGSAPKAELVGSVEFASFSDYQKKIVDLGTTINNPIVSMMAVPVIQSNLTENFGSFRPDSPMKLLCYADVAAVRKALTSDSDDFGDDAPPPDAGVDAPGGVPAAPNFAARDSQGDLENRQKKFGMMMKPFSL